MTPLNITSTQDSLVSLPLAGIESLAPTSSTFLEGTLATIALCLFVHAAPNIVERFFPRARPGRGGGLDWEAGDKSGVPGEEGSDEASEETIRELRCELQDARARTSRMRAERPSLVSRSSTDTAPRSSQELRRGTRLSITLSLFPAQDAPHNPPRPVSHTKPKARPPRRPLLCTSLLAPPSTPKHAAPVDYEPVGYSPFLPQGLLPDGPVEPVASCTLFPSEFRAHVERVSALARSSGDVRREKQEVIAQATREFQRSASAP
ncbi:uncharacterized protein BXZ73DRAFT_97810 [Epithele typhae]|uniref:uncharacterized protein n=1 Tax=Epithele typhae TaxID=378194 RepID=UPI00200826F3|nr:uncharacterized protein BXZ73DRAFT_97810 [Epithele typhae]KAH9942398.1 hypothetical protein BXZ73DRAFT_97810 [Epithele typhae]